MISQGRVLSHFGRNRAGWIRQDTSQNAKGVRGLKHLARNSVQHGSQNQKRRSLERTLVQQGRRTLVILLPTYYNPNALGVRKKVEPEKWRATTAEFERFFSGYQRMHIKGWNRVFLCGQPPERVLETCAACGFVMLA